MIVKAGWVCVVMVAMAVMTRGLWAGVYFEPTGEAIAMANRGLLLVALASTLLLGAALHAYRALAAPAWVAMALVAAAALCVLAANSPAIPVLALLAAYPLTFGAIIGVLAQPRGR